MTSKRWLVVPPAIVLVLFSSPAHAYLDPGTGAMIVQLVIGAIAVAGVTLKVYWHKFLSLFSHHRQNKQDNED